MKTLASHHVNSIKMATSSCRLIVPISLCAIFLTLTLSYLTLNSNLSVSTPPARELSPIPISTEPCADSFAEMLNITWHKEKASLAPDPLPPGHADKDGAVIIPFLLSLSRSSTWRSVANVSLQGNTHEPEGMVVLPPNRLIVSSAEYTVPTKPFPGGEPINGTDRTPGAGFAHLQTFSFPEGELIADATVSREGRWEYHNGGIDWDGEFIWGVLGQRRPGSTGTVYLVDPRSLEGRAVVGFKRDHLGTVVRDRERNEVVGMSWGGRKGYVFDTSHGDECIVLEPEGFHNPSHFVDYQDCKSMGAWEGQSIALCSGVSKLNGGEYTLGGLALVDIDTLRPIWELPVELESEKGVRLTMNPFDVTVDKGGKVRFWWAPDQHETVVYGFEVDP